MNSSKRQQSFSSYSQQDFNDPHPSEQDKFSEYEQHFQSKLDKSDKLKEPEAKLGQRRRYSYAPTLYSSNLQNLKQCKYIKGIGSPCGIGAFDSFALEEYEKCYLSGLSKYYKSHNYIGKKQTKPTLSVSSSLGKDKNLDRSEYWNGQKFQYLAVKQKQQFPQQVKERKRSESNQNNERNLNSGLIVNKKEIKQNRGNEPAKANKKKDSSQYIKIEEDFSNSKNCSEVKMPTNGQNINATKIISQPLTQQPVKPNPQPIPKSQLSDTQFQAIRLNSNSISPSHSQKDFATILTQKNHLAQQNASLRQTVAHKNSEIQRLSRQRIKDNDDYSHKIQTLKILFENQKNSLLKQHEEQLSVYKQVRKQAIQNQLVKQEEERLSLIIHKNRIQNELKRVTQQLSWVKEELETKNNKLASFEKKILTLQNQSHSQNRNNLMNDLNKSLTKESNLPLKNQHKKEAQSVWKEKEVPEWIINFLSVFKNMVKKLIVQRDQKWSDKKLIIIGWKMVKILIEKAVKLGIKVPEVINENEMGECSIVSYPCKNTQELKKYNLTGSKKPIRS